MIIRDISDNRAGATGRELFGLEIEVESVTTPEDWERSGWDIIPDGSLRDGGREFVSKPSTYDECMVLIDKFYEWNSALGYESSIRTSTHVHANVLEFDSAEVAAACTAYAVVEPLLFRVCGQMREENIYCVPWYRGANETAHVRSMCNGQLTGVMEACKYSALYLTPIFTFGTVEFRHAPVFPDADTMKFWLDLVRAVVYNGGRLGTGEEIIALVDDIGIDAFADKLFGTESNVRLKTYCEQSYEDIIDEADSVFIAEACVPSLYTYKVTDDWNTGPSAEGDRQVGYHRTIPSRVSQPVYHIDEDMDHGYDEFSNDEDEY